MTTSLVVDTDDVVRRAFARVLSRDPLTLHPGLRLADLEADSLVLVCVADVIEDGVAALVPGAGFAFDDHDLARLPDLASFSSYVRDRLPAAARG